MRLSPPQVHPAVHNSGVIELWLRGAGEAVRMWREAVYDAILMDCHVPEIDGYQATGEIRALEDKAGGRTPIIAMTANAMRGDREKCLAAGMDDDLAKPIRTVALHEVLDRCRAAPGDDPSPPAVDRDVLAELREEMGEDAEEMFGELIQSFLSETGTDLRQARAALEENDTKRLIRMAHTIKGSALTMGALALAGLGEELEGRVNADQLSGALEIIEQMDHEFARAALDLGAVQENPSG